MNMTSFQHVPVCVFFELYNLFDTITFQTACICRLTDYQICKIFYRLTEILSFYAFLRPVYGRVKKIRVGRPTGTTHTFHLK